MSNVIFTCQPASGELCLNEMNSAGLDFTFIRWLDGGVGLVRTVQPFAEFSGSARAAKLIFLRHIFPVDAAVEFETPADITGSSAFTAAVEDFTAALEEGASFSVQARRSADSDADIKPLKHYIAGRISDAGHEYQTSCPDRIISLYMCDKTVYLGLSDAGLNLSGWPGGMRRFAMTDDTVSRAEFKLLEAMEYLGFAPAGGKALDLGAAPGGWSRVLADRGYFVTAVDPAELDARVAKNDRVGHYRGLAEDFAAQSTDKFDIIVNDMKMDVHRSAGIILDFYDRLSDSGTVIMTFKLEKKNRMSAIKKGISALSAKYNVIMAKQLFNNRSEITVALKKKAE